MQWLQWMQCTAWMQCRSIGVFWEAQESVQMTSTTIMPQDYVYNLVKCACPVSCHTVTLSTKIKGAAGLLPFQCKSNAGWHSPLKRSVSAWFNFRSLTSTPHEFLHIIFSRNGSECSDCSECNARRECSVDPSECFGKRKSQCRWHRLQ